MTDIKKAGSRAIRLRKKLAKKQFNSLEPTLSPEQINNLKEMNEKNFCELMQRMTNQKNQADAAYKKLL